MLTELSKTGAPSLLLQDFNYFFNKAINQYINKRYNIYDVNQQTTDDLRVLKATSILPVRVATDSYPLSALVGLGAGKSKIFDATYEVDLPQDYLHILNCVCIYKVNKRFKCYNEGDYIQMPARRLNGDSWSIIVNDYFNRPLPERPYYYIHNINLNIENDLMPTNPSQFEEVKYGTDDDEHLVDENGKYTTKELVRGTDLNATDYEKEVWIAYGIGKDSKGYKGYGDSEADAKANLTASAKEAGTDVVTDNITTEKILTSKEGNSNYPRTVKLNQFMGFDSETGKPKYQKVVTDSVEKSSAQRYGNASKVRMEIRYGHDRSIFELYKVFVDYIKTPQYIRLTQEQVNLTEDTSQIMEFPDYVCQEIINELTTLVMENLVDPRLQTHPAVTQSIANPAQQPQPTQQQQRVQRQG